MGGYKNFVVDFPSRCIKDILNNFYNAIEANERDVTFLLMAASAAFVIPFERIQPKPRKEHPSKDIEKFKSAMELKSIWEISFLNSELWNNKPMSWEFGDAEIVDGQLIPSNTKTLKGQQISEILPRMRNAFAHGNIYTINESIIDKIFFVAGDTEMSKEYKFISVSPEDFKIFLNNWVTFLEKS